MNARVTDGLGEGHLDAGGRHLLRVEVIEADVDESGRFAEELAFDAFDGLTTKGACYRLAPVRKAPPPIRYRQTSDPQTCVW